MTPDEMHTALSIETVLEMVQAELEARRQSISRELCTIPSPVPACDVNFNRLLEERAGITDELQRLRRLAAAGSDASGVLAFCSACALLSEPTKEEVQRLLADTRRVGSTPHAG
jgi:hypothetical protein